MNDFSLLSHDISEVKYQNCASEFFTDSKGKKGHQIMFLMFIYVIAFHFHPDKTCLPSYLQ
uniref:Uncharacterized protein n=1 Tax=Arundo donax TaxID=35708 RepID=A0A0A8ZBY5_ARUDO